MYPFTLSFIRRLLHACSEPDTVPSAEDRRGREMGRREVCKAGSRKTRLVAGAEF